MSLYFKLDFFFFRLCRTPSPRKCRLFESRGSEPDIGFNILNSGLQLSSPDDEEINEEAPLCAFSPARPSSLENRLDRERDTPQNKLKRRLFVGNLPSYVSLVALCILLYSCVFTLFIFCHWNKLSTDRFLLEPTGQPKISIIIQNTCVNENSINLSEANWHIYRIFCHIIHTQNFF